MEETVSLMDIFAAVFRGWKKVLVVALVVAVALGGYQGHKQISLANDPSNTPEQIEQRYTEALEVYAKEKARLENTLEKAQLAYAYKQEYMENSLFQAMNPYNQYISYITVSFTGISEDTITPVIPYEGIAAEYMVNTIRAQYIELWTSMDVTQTMRNSPYADTEEKYLRELIIVEPKDGGLLEIRACAATSADSELFVNSIYDYFSAQQEKISESAYSHQLLPVSRVTKCIINESMIEAQQDAINTLANTENAVVAAETALDELSAPQKETVCGTSEIIKTVLKFAVIGFVAGAVLVCFGICCISLFSTKISSSHQVERMTCLRFAGSLSVPKNIFDKCAHRLAGERIWANAEMAGAYIAEQANVLCGDDKQLLILSTLPAKKAQKATDYLCDLLSTNGFAVKLILDAAHNPESIRAIQSSSNILLAESVDASRMGTVLDVTTQVKNAEKQISGFVMF